MANIFKINPSRYDADDANSGNFDIPSVAYINTLFSKIKADINNLAAIAKVHSNGSVGDLAINSIDDDITELNLITENNRNSVLAVDVQTDPTHRFVTDSQIDIFKSKLTKLDLEAAIIALQKEYKSYYNGKFDQILNDPDALAKLKDLSYAIKEDAELSGLLEAINLKADAFDLELHKNSAGHLNNNDRQALNLLLKFIQSGCADWNAGPDAANYIRNKPSKLPADGGNADTIDGYSAESLVNKQTADVIFGVHTSSYLADTCDYIVGTEDNGIKLYEAFKYIANRKYGGLYHFKSGSYIMKDPCEFTPGYDVIDDIIIQGSGNNTEFYCDYITASNHIVFKDMAFVQSEIAIGSNMTFDNVKFTNCTLELRVCDAVTIRNCTFKNCKITFTGTCSNLMFIFNRMIATPTPYYVGGNNIIQFNQ